ncbi:hypothetical protein M9Y10_007971 [Tritrichomonas musculus]|uniref:Protein kinase domain-containing protein n=1 Tax=Tritrichomonas musculus TaxID=1915356 RepID=A0ABR2J2U9_9EUKA
MNEDEFEKMKNTLKKHGYEYIRPIGSGAFSSVHLCQATKYLHQFAIKKVSKNKISPNEYNALISLDHPNIIKLYVTFEDEDSQYLVMEYCPNGSLCDQGCLNSEKFISYSKQILEALNYCHSKNIAHRDIKPANIFLDQYDHPKLADFGLARQFDSNQTTEEKCGTLMYFAPEFLKQPQQICPFKADIWALGITFYYLITGKKPFPNKTIDELKNAIQFGEITFPNKEIDPQIRFLISKMTTINRKMRPTAEQLLQYPIYNSLKNGRLARSNCSLNCKKNIKMPYYCTGYSTNQAQLPLLRNQSLVNTYSTLEKPPQFITNVSSSDKALHLSSTQEGSTNKESILSFNTNRLFPSVNKMNCQYKPFKKPS